MKLVSIIENVGTNYGGPAQSLPMLLKTLQEVYHLECEGVSGFSSQFDMDNEFLYSHPAIKWNFCKMLGHSKFAYAPDLRKQMFDLVDSSTVVYVNNLWNGFPYLAYRFCKANDVPYVVAPRGGLFPWSLSQGVFRKKIAWMLFQRRMLSEASFVHVTSEDERDAIKTLGITSKIVLAPHGVTIPPLDSLGSREQSAKKLGLDPNGTYLLFMSRLHSKKGLDMLLSVWPKVAREYSGAKLMVVGPDYGGYTKTFERMKEADKEHIVFVPKLVGGEEKENFFNLSDIFVLPSYTENFGVVIAEALARAKLVVTTYDTPWSPLNKMGGGIVVHSNESDLEKALRCALEMPSKERKLMGRKGREYVSDNYSWRSAADNFWRALKEI